MVGIDWLNTLITFNIKQSINSDEFVLFFNFVYCHAELDSVSHALKNQV